MKKLAVLVLCLTSLNVILAGCIYGGNISKKYIIRDADATSTVM